VFLGLVSSLTTFQCIMELDKEVYIILLYYFVFISTIYCRNCLDLVLDAITTVEGSGEGIKIIC